MVDELCKDKGDDYRRYDELLGLIRECVNFEAASITDDSLPGDLTIDDILDAAELMCHYNEKGQSCGVRIFGDSVDNTGAGRKWGRGKGERKRPKGTSTG